MKRRILCLIVLLACCFQAGAYTDHRGHNLDSLELAVAPWTADKIANASAEELLPLVRAYQDLMLGYEVMNGEKSVFYARKVRSISARMQWLNSGFDAARHIGQYFYATERYDSAMFYFKECLAMLEKMEGGATSATNPDGYDEKTIDDNRSALYGAIGNLYNVMGSIPEAMDYYAKAGEIFEKWGWNESNSVLYYNIGETWVDEGDYKSAFDAYRKSLDYARAADDSLLVANALKGLGGWYMDKGKTYKALRCLKEADEYYSHHDDQEFRFRMENLDFLSQVLEKQKRGLVLYIIALALVLALAIASGVLYQKLKLRRREKAEAEVMMDETIEELRSPSADVKLNDRERAILRLMASGKTTAAIADEICLSPETVKWYRKKLFAKFNVANASELIRRVTEEHIV